MSLSADSGRSDVSDLDSMIAGDGPKYTDGLALSHEQTVVLTDIGLQKLLNDPMRPLYPIIDFVPPLLAQYKFVPPRLKSRFTQKRRRKKTRSKAKRSKRR